MIYMAMQNEELSLQNINGIRWSFHLIIDWERAATSSKRDVEVMKN